MSRVLDAGPCREELPLDSARRFAVAFGARLRTLRERAGLSREVLAERAEIRSDKSSALESSTRAAQVHYSRKSSRDAGGATCHIQWRRIIPRTWERAHTV